MARTARGAVLRRAVAAASVLAAVLLVALALNPRGPGAGEPTPHPIATIPATPAASPAADDRYVAPTGDDANPGTSQRPYRTIAFAIEQLNAGDTLWLRDGTYVEDITTPDIRPGRPTARITVAAYPGERPVLRGLLWLRGADYWTLDGLSITWAESNDETEQMVKMTDGIGWEVLNSELWGARSFAALLVAGTTAGEPSDWLVRGNCIHDVVTQPIHHVNGDHDVYVNTGASAGPGLIERNLFYNAPNGQNIKLGFGRSDPQPGDGAANVTIRYNTLYGSLKNLSLADDTAGVTIEGNIIMGSEEGYAVRAYRLSGSDNVVRDNLIVGMGELQYGDDGYGTVTDGGGNVFSDELSFDEIGCGGFRPTDPEAQRYGRYAADG